MKWIPLTVPVTAEALAIGCMKWIPLMVPVTAEALAIGCMKWIPLKFPVTAEALNWVLEINNPALSTDLETKIKKTLL
jgi:hypothetical protein